MTFHTQDDSMRADADGWDTEDGNMAAYKLDKPVGYMSGYSVFLPPTPLHALGAGWKLLAPPVKLTDNPYFKYKWWFVKD